MPKFVEGDMVVNTDAACCLIGRVWASRYHEGQHWYWGINTEGIQWICPESKLDKFQCTPIRYVEKPNTKPGPVLSVSKY
jgi:hypothetical protein